MWEAGMRKWRTAGIEPSLDELLGDELMIPVMKSAGLSADDIRALVVETAERLGDNDNDHELSGCAAIG
jgi:hypothetical protein